MWIKFKTNGWASAIGGFDTGDRANVSEEMAAHFVKDAMCAEYDEVKAAPEVKTDPVEDDKPKRGRPAKAEK